MKILIEKVRQEKLLSDFAVKEWLPTDEQFHSKKSNRQMIVFKAEDETKQAIVMMDSMAAFHNRLVEEGSTDDVPFVNKKGKALKEIEDGTEVYWNEGFQFGCDNYNLIQA